MSAKEIHDGLLEGLDVSVKEELNRRWSQNRENSFRGQWQSNPRGILISWRRPSYYTLAELVDDVGIWNGTTHAIVQDNMQFRNVCARFHMF